MFLLIFSNFVSAVMLLFVCSVNFCGKASSTPRKVIMTRDVLIKKDLESNSIK